MAAYSAPGIIFIPVMGILADRYGKKKVLLPSMLLFAFGGTACAIAQDTETLLLFRFLQGIGACALATINTDFHCTRLFLSFQLWFDHYRSFYC